MGSLQDFLIKTGLMRQQGPQGAPVPTPQAVGSGMAAQAATNLNGNTRDAYNNYAIDKQTNGGAAVSYPDFIQGKR